MFLRKIATVFSLLSSQILLCFPAIAGSIADMKVVATSSNWELRTENDSFSGETSCVIVQKDHFSIQVNLDSFYVSYHGRGGVQGYKFRIDDNPPSEMRIPSQIEKDIDAVAFSGADFGEIIRARRLRVQALTYTNGVQDDDIDLRGLAALFGQMSSGCPGGKEGNAGTSPGGGSASEQDQVLVPPIPRKTITIRQPPLEGRNNRSNAQGVFYQEKTSASQGSADPVDVHWELVESGSGEPAIRAEVSIPSSSFRFSLTIRRNVDAALPASQLVELTFVGSEGLDQGGIESVLGISMKNSEQDPGDRLNGSVTQVSDGYFLIATSDGNAESVANMKLLRRSWIDVPFTFKSGRRALLTLEKGPSGTKVFTRAIQSWRTRPTVASQR